MKIYFVEKALISVALLSVSTAVLSSLSPNVDLMSTAFSPRTQATASTRGLVEPRRVSPVFQTHDRSGKTVVVDPQARMILKGTMSGAMADSYQGAQYLTQRDLKVDVGARR